MVKTAKHKYGSDGDSNHKAAQTKQGNAPFSRLEELIGHKFREQEYLHNALIHKSYLHAVPDFELGSNERLEFLGDAVLGLITSGDLYRTHPDVGEGQLSALRGALVRKDTLARLAQRLDLGAFLFLGHGEESAGGRHRASNLARAMEALLGAVYLDGGLEAAERVWHTVLGDESDESLQEVLSADYKSRLQQLTQASLKLTPSYRLSATSGPEHEKEFTVEALLGERVVAAGTGRSKQLAEQKAAEAALRSVEAELAEGTVEAGPQPTQ